MVAGLHFPVDLVAGLVLGQSLARYAHAMAQPSWRPESWPCVVVDSRRYQALGPLGGLHAGVDVMRAFERSPQAGVHATRPAPLTCQAPVWAELWRAAAQEWREIQHDA